MTLLFQPDCRVFCLKGPVHQGMIHTTRDVVRAAAARDLRRHPPATVANAPPNTTVTIPYVRQCWSVPAELAGARLPAALQGRTVLIWVHGFRQLFYPVLNAGAHVLHRLNEGVEGEGPRPAVMTFMWPAYQSKLAYSSARGNTPEAGARLKRLLQLLKQHGCRCVVAGHSMGCRVALHALLELDAVEGEPLCDQLVLIAAAVSSNSLAPAGSFPRANISAARLTVVSSRQDDVLRDIFPKGELMSNLSMPSALGYEGPEPPVPPSVEHLDASSSIAGHSPNVALLSWEVRRLLREAVGLPAPPVPADDAMSSDSWSSLLLSEDSDTETVSLDEDTEGDD